MQNYERTWKIEDLLHRRSDPSTFVIHWTRDSEDSTARDHLYSILSEGVIRARSPMGPAAKALLKLSERGKLTGSVFDKAANSQRVVCFTEAPIEQAWSFVCEIEGRQIRLRPYGLAFTKPQARKMGINPVWYTDATPTDLRADDWLIRYVDKLVERALADPPSFTEDPISAIAPLIEVMGTWDGSRKEFWWEREWRHRGDVHFLVADVAIVLCPESEMETFQEILDPSIRTVPVIDPTWGLEYIIAKLAGISPT